MKTVKKGESAKLFCSAEGDQPITINWFKEGQLLNKSKIPGYLSCDGENFIKIENLLLISKHLSFLLRIEIYESQTTEGVSSELFIASTDRNDGGNYNCKVENAYGKDEKTNKLLVIESPGAPTGLTIRE